MFLAGLCVSGEEEGRLRSRGLLWVRCGTLHRLGGGPVSEPLLVVLVSFTICLHRGSIEHLGEDAGDIEVAEVFLV